MSSAVDHIPKLAGRRTRAAIESSVPAGVGVALCLLLAVAQVAIAGYRLGVGNQAIQIAFLKHWADPALFARDEMVRQTLPLYPSYFFRLLAPLLNVFPLDSLYFTLHVLTTFFTLVTVYFLGRSIFRSHASALAAVGILLAGHHRALAGDTLYSPGFTHTYVALPLALAALGLAYRRHMVWAFAVAGVLFDLHALTGAYTLLMLIAALLADFVETPRRQWLIRVVVCAVVSVVIAAPTLLLMLHNQQTFDAAWLNLMRIRSGDHSFPATWWGAGNPDLPRFALLFAMFALSWGFSPARRADAMRALRVSVFMSFAVLDLFIIGYVFTELVPIQLIIRLQPFRASRLLMVLMFVHIAHAAMEAIRVGWTGRALTPDSSMLPLSKPVRAAELLAGVMILATLGVPSLLPLLPLTVLVVTIAAFISGRLSILQAIIAAASLVIAVLAYLQIQFPLPFLSSDFTVAPHEWLTNGLAWFSLLTALVFAILLSVLRRPLPRKLALALALIVGAICTGLLFGREFRNPPVNRNIAGIAQWARTQTPKYSVFLTPTGMSDFRIHADRALVADWRDGTQLYFSGNFATEWFNRVNDIEPGITRTPDGRRLLTRGRPLDTLDTDALVALTKKYNAAYLVLPTPAKDHERPLQVAFTDSYYTAYLPIPTAVAADIPKGVINPAQWLAMQTFMETTVQQNIEKYRKADVTIQVVDPNGRPVQDLPVVLNQTRHAFNFGCSLGFFEPNNINPNDDQKPAPVTPQELKLLPTVFNASMIPFSSKWTYVEREPGKLYFNDLDKYVDYCTRNRITMEYHFLSGMPPGYMFRDIGRQAREFPKYADDVVGRYADRIKYWQVTNEGRLMQNVPAVVKDLRKKYPNLKLGIADCVKFWSDDWNPFGARSDMYRGLQAVPWLKGQGVKLDFFGIHGHRPYGLWADPRTMYEVFDTVAKQGVKVHVTEMLLPIGNNIIGPVRRGIWTPQLQAQFLADYLTVCFSHPAVELVNFWGLVPDGWGESAGLLDEHRRPRPAFDRLKQLINETWHTRVATTLPVDGTLSARAFHGTYDLSFTFPDGSTVNTTLTVPEETSANFRICLDAAKKTATIQERPTATAPAATNP
ncbi:MAG TPA: endo-1,4-beta-xylanase [Phycisphaerae bacterium]|nr:endo-1,4-beta-xylanase [Phycisphaerae bacterium]